MACLPMRTLRAHLWQPALLPLLLLVKVMVIVIVIVIVKVMVMVIVIVIVIVIVLQRPSSGMGLAICLAMSRHATFGHPRGNLSTFSEQTLVSWARANVAVRVCVEP